jgi:mannose/fructose/N-acetylgalactosamine-specific phosphotransferase system component IIB
MAIILLRVDNRLIHGQVIASWVPRLDIEAVLVADDAMARDEFAVELARLAVPREIDLEIVTIAEARSRLDNPAWSEKRVLVLLRDLEACLRVFEGGLESNEVNLGNLHYAAGKRQLSPAVAVSEREEGIIRLLESRHIVVEIRAVPKEHSRRAIDLL